MRNNLLALLTALALLFGCKEDNTFKDKRDGKKYKYVKIGEQVWMAENLNYNTENSKCYVNKPENCDKYGRLYNWNAAMKVCPVGWHLPNNEEWDILYKFADWTLGKDSSESPYLSKTAGKYLKATTGWNDYDEGESGNGEDEFGFAALPGGNIDHSDGCFGNIGRRGYWWTASEYNARNAYSRYLVYNYKGATWKWNYKDDNWFSIRCVRD